MRSKYLGIPLAVATLACASVACAFTADDFNDGTLGTQWTFIDSNPTGTTWTEENGQFEMWATIDSDHFFWIDKEASIEQDAPTGTNWEVVTKLDGFDPTVEGQRRRFTRAGIRLWQDNDHFITLSVLSSGDGLMVNSQNLWQFDANVDGGLDPQLQGAIDLIGYPGVVSSVWMKIRSSAVGYQGFMSIDGINWLECLSIVKNHDSPDGLLQNPKIRLFHAGGFLHGANNQQTTPAKFDFIESNTYTATDLPYADDEFNGTTLSPQWGFFPGIGEGFYGFDEGQLVLSGGPFSNLWSDREQPTYIYQNAPDLPGYSLTVKVAPTNMTEIPYEKWNAYGIWLWKDQSHWALISNSRGDEEQTPGSNVWLPNNRIESAIKYDKGHFVSGSLDFDLSPAPSYLRIVNDGTNIELQYSFDGTTYTPYTFNLGGVNQSKFNIGQDDLQVRLFTKRVFGDGDDGGSGENPPMDGEFDWLRAEPFDAAVADWNLY